MRRIFAIVVSVVVVGLAGAGTATAAGSNLTAQEFPGRLDSVSCPTTSFCMAITTATASDGKEIGVAEIERHGTWTVSRTPDLGKRIYLNGVSCVSATSCTAVGSPDEGHSPLVIRWDGSQWQVVPGAAPTDSGGLSSVSCVTADHCIAGGGVAFQQGLAVLVRGDQWTVTATPPIGRIRAVSCVSTVFCIAAADGQPNSGREPGVVERWDGSNWSDVPAAGVYLGLHHPVRLTGVSCTSVDECSLVGDVYDNRTADQQYRVITEDDVDGQWHFRRLPKTAGVNIVRTVSSVSCTAPEHCVAAARIPVKGHEADRALVRSPRGWTFTPLRYPHGKLLITRIAAISCTDGGCTLVGGPRLGGGASRGVAVHDLRGTVRGERLATF